MIMQEFTLTVTPWKVTVFYHPSWRNLDLIIKTLYDAGCDGEDLDDAVNTIESGYLNTGFTFTNGNKRVSVLIISKTTDASQFNDTYDHEKGHLAMHICQYDDIDPFSEDYQYLTGEIGRMMFPVAKHFLCDHCRGLSE